MRNWKSYVGSILVAGLLLQGCGGSTEEAANVQPSATAKAAREAANAILTITKVDSPSAKLAMASGELSASKDAETYIKNALDTLVATTSVTQEEADAFIAENDLNQVFVHAYFQAVANKSVILPANQPNGFFDDVLAGIRDGLIDLIDSDLGTDITAEIFELMLNSEGVTVLMIDMARGSTTISQIMIDVLGDRWDLTTAMCPMLQTNVEFGEKFTALAYEMDGSTDKPDMGGFFFANVDAPLYGCLSDAMVLSSDESVHNEDVNHSTNGYMGLLMERYAVDFFIEPGTGTDWISATNHPYGSYDAFSRLMFDTGALADDNATLGHGDRNELTNEKFFYATFRTPYSTDSFIAAMQAVETNNPATVTLFMDQIFLGEQNTTIYGPVSDPVQGYYNIKSIAGAMAEGMSNPMYGFSDYSGAFVDFALLIPGERYFAYAKAFLGAGWYFTSGDVWSTIVAGAEDLWNSFTLTATVTAATPGNTILSGMNGTLGSEWISDTIDVTWTAWDEVDLSLLEYWLSNLTLFDYYNNEAYQGYTVFLSGTITDENNVTTEYPTALAKSADIVLGLHGLFELAIREDMVNARAGDGTDYTMADAANDFVLPPFSDISWSFVYNAASDGVVAYWNNVVDAGWLADLSTNDLVREYFYPSADNIYIPSWLLAIDWLKFPDNFNSAEIGATDFNFDAGYMDIYVVSTNEFLMTDIDLPQAVDPLKPITMEKIDMSSDSIIIVDENGVNENGLHVYKIRVVSPEDTAAVLAYLSDLGTAILNGIGIDSTNAAQTAQ